LKSAFELKTKSEVKRIVSTLPSATEIVCLLGLKDKLVGITHECDYPASVRSKPVVMSSVFDARKMNSKEIDHSVTERHSQGRPIYTIDEELLQRLNPDLIITQELCEVCATPLQVVAKSVSRLNPRPDILSLSPHTLEDVIQDIIDIGIATGRARLSLEIADSLKRRINKVKQECLKLTASARPSVFCLEWLEPLYCSGHWMPEIVQYAGGREVLGRLGEPSIVTKWEQVLEENPEVIFVTVCGYDIERTLAEISLLTKRDRWNSLQAVKAGKVFVLDGQSYYSRSGPRLVDGLEIMAFLLHPELFSDYKLPDRAAYSLFKERYVQSE
jgi:iron complex transport system substrate-binding protein